MEEHHFVQELEPVGEETQGARQQWYGAWRRPCGLRHPPAVTFGYCPSPGREWGR